MVESTAGGTYTVAADIYGAGKGIGEVIGGIESGVGAAKTSVDKDLLSGDVIG
mgnify:FL=1